MIKSSQKFWVVYVQYRFIYEQCGFSRLVYHRNHYFGLGSIPIPNSWVRLRGPVIQANGRLTFEDDLRSGGLLYFTTQ